jgi:uncharacterized protein YaeQ
MALRATVFKLDLHVADMRRGYYGSHALTLARHPSETDERMMLRVLAYALFADEGLAFTRGLSTTEEPALWRKDLTGAIEQWIELGHPDERRMHAWWGGAAPGAPPAASAISPYYRSIPPLCVSWAPTPSAP